MYVYNIVFTLKAQYDLDCVKSAVKPQPTNLKTEEDGVMEHHVKKLAV